MSARTMKAPDSPSTAASARLFRHLGALRLGVSGTLGLLVVLGWLLVALAAPWWVSDGAQEIGALPVFAPPQAGHWLGADYLGRDMLARVLLGARYTVVVALVAAMLASAIGTSFALLAVVGGGWFDAALSRGMDTLISIPSKLFALIMVAAFGSSVSLLVITAAVIYVPGSYRIARALAVNVAALDYVLIARTRGESRAYLMFREVLPNIIAPVMVDLGLRFVYVVLLLASLSFLGLGVQPPAADWGTLVRENLGALWEGGLAVVAPALAIASLTMAVNLVVDALPGRATRRRKS
ncbi:ABC transporter permease [Pseudoxanthomonas wuyuanensis]